MRPLLPPGQSADQDPPPRDSHIQLWTRSPPPRGMREGLVFGLHQLSQRQSAGLRVRHLRELRPAALSPWRGSGTRCRRRRGEAGRSPGANRGGTPPSSSQPPPDLSVWLPRRFLQPPRGPVRAQRVQKCERAARTRLGAPGRGQPKLPATRPQSTALPPAKGATGPAGPPAGRQAPRCR